MPPKDVNTPIANPLETASLSGVPPQLADELAALPLFKRVSASTLQLLAANTREVTYRPGESVLTPDTTLFVIAAGEVDCTLRDAANKEYSLGRVRRGDVLGELSFLVPEGARDQKVFLEAVDQVRGFSMPARLFYDNVVGDIDSPARLLQVMMARRLAATNGFTQRAVDVHLDPSQVPAITFGERLADWMTDHIGTYRFLCGFGAISLGWVGMNSGLFFMRGWDPYPFILLNLVYSVVSAMTMPVLLMSQRRQSQLDALAARSARLMIHESAKTNERVLEEVAQVRREIAQLRDSMALE